MRRTPVPGLSDWLDVPRCLCDGGNGRVVQICFDRKAALTVVGKRRRPARHSAPGFLAG